MKTAAKFFGMIFLGGLLSAAAFGSEMYKPMGDGMPLPWPFPWAKDCPVNWEAMQGRYLLQPSDSRPQIDLNISVIRDGNSYALTVVRYGGDGLVEAVGTAWLASGSNQVHLWLYPTHSGDSPTWAALRMYHSDRYLLCDADRLVPILSLVQVGNTRKETQYRMVRTPYSKN